MFVFLTDESSDPHLVLLDWMLVQDSSQCANHLLLKITHVPTFQPLTILQYAAMPNNLVFIAF